MLHGQWQNRTSKLDVFKPYLDQRIAEGCTNVSRLHRELQERGARCSYSTLRDYVRPLRPDRQSPGSPPPIARPPSPREATGWIMRHPDHLREDDQQQLKTLLARSPELTAAATHVRTFAGIMSNREGDRLGHWIADVCADEPCGPAGFATGLLSDLDAVVYGMSTDWSSGSGRGPRQRPQGAQAQHVRPSKAPAAAQTAPPDRRQPPTTARVTELAEGEGCCAGSAASRLGALDAVEVTSEKVAVADGEVSVEQSISFAVVLAHDSGGQEGTQAVAHVLGVVNGFAPLGGSLVGREQDPMIHGDGGVEVWGCSRVAVQRGHGQPVGVERRVPQQQGLGALCVSVVEAAEDDGVVGEVVGVETHEVRVEVRPPV
ncbi:hypothetical protein [Kitasatospora sp. NPDC054795]